MGTAEIVGVATGVIGTLVAVYSAYSQRREKGSRIKVEVNNSLLDYETHLSDLVLTIRASNPGHKPVTLSSQGFILPDEKRMFLRNPGSDVRFPHVLAPERSCTVWVNAHDLARLLKSEGYGGKIKLVGFYLDQVDRMYKSRGWEFDIEEWL
jgi:hypothetical protein